MSQGKERKIQIHNSHAKTARNVLHSSVLSVATSTTTKCKPLNFMHATGKKKNTKKKDTTYIGRIATVSATPTRFSAGGREMSLHFCYAKCERGVA